MNEKKRETYTHVLHRIGVKGVEVERKSVLGWEHKQGNSRERVSVRPMLSQHVFVDQEQS